MKILLVEDSVIERRKVGMHLTEWGLEYVSVGSGTEAVKLLEGAEPPDMVLLDWVLPDLDGIQICRRIRSLPLESHYIYTVMLTSKNRKQDLLVAMDAGADDYLVKPVNVSELRARILAGKRILDLQHSLRFAATHDFLTGLLNRSEILAALQREFSRSGRENRPAVIISADIDHFKRVNDSMGHSAGDAVLKEVANRLKSTLRPYDLLGRFGGEEFLLILPGCELHIGIRRANEIRELVARQPITTQFGSASPTVSMGVTVTCSSIDHTVSDILHQADVALYTAKENGRNRVEEFSAAGKANTAGS